MHHPPLPPGVYFSPTREESVEYLNRWIAGEELPGARGFVFEDDVYAVNPDTLRRAYPPGNTRGGDHKWWFLCESRFQSVGSASKRADRRVATGGYWQLEQSKKELPGAVGVSNSFGFYLGPTKKEKMSWLMEEYTSTDDDGTGKRGVPALHRIYVSPRATDDTLRDIYGEDGVPFGLDGVKKPVRVTVPTEYFDAIAAQLPPGSVRGGVVQEEEQGAPAGLVEHHYGLQGQFFEAAPQLPPPPPPPPAPAGLVEHYGSQVQFLEAAPPAADILGHSTGQFWDDVAMTWEEFDAIVDEQPGDAGDEPLAILDEQQGDTGDEPHATLDERQGDTGNAVLDEQQGHAGGELGVPDLGMPIWGSLVDICVIEDFLKLKCDFEDTFKFQLDCEIAWDVPLVDSLGD